MPATMGQPGGSRQVAHKWLCGCPNGPPQLIILKLSSLSDAGTPSSGPGAACDPYPRFWPVLSSCSLRLHRPTAAFSSSPTRLTAMASTSVSPKATNAAPMQPDSIANRGISPGRPPIGASIRRKSPARFPRARTAITREAPNTSPLPANAEPALGERILATPAPRKRRDAAPRRGYGKRVVARIGQRCPKH